MNSETPDSTRLQPTPVAPLAVLGVIGLIAGWAIRPVWQWLDQSPPVITWAQVGVLYLGAAVLAVVTWQTRQAVRRPLGLAPYRAVNRLVLAKACALVGALVAGGYAGYAITWVDSEALLATQRIVRSGLAALAGLCVMTAALLLERACRVPDDDQPPDVAA